jgi:hypothetical protein
MSELAKNSKLLQSLCLSDTNVVDRLKQVLVKDLMFFGKKNSKTLTCPAYYCSDWDEHYGAFSRDKYSWVQIIRFRIASINKEDECFLMRTYYQRHGAVLKVEIHLYIISVSIYIMLRNILILNQRFINDQCKFWIMKTLLSLNTSKH